jgi:cell division septum initiation protein DivIVA
MITVDYVKQLESANEELQRKLEEQGQLMDSLSAAFAQTRNEMKRNHLVVLCDKDYNLVRNAEMLQAAALAVVPASQEEKQKVFVTYQISHAKLSLFKSIKDRFNKRGSFYDIDMLNAYGKGETVKPYVI